MGVPPYPLNVNSGIGYLINPDESFVPMVAENFSMHEHGFPNNARPPVMRAPHIPDPTRAVVTYTFNAPTVVDQLEINQHTNGITRVEGFVGDSLDSLISIGSIFGPDDDVTGLEYFSETQSYVFDFNNEMPGEIFQFVIRKTSHWSGYAAYRAFPRDAEGTRYAAAQVIPEPTSMITWSLIGLTFGVGYWRRRKRGAV